MQIVGATEFCSALYQSEGGDVWVAWEGVDFEDVAQRVPEPVRPAWEFLLELRHEACGTEDWEACG